MTVDDGIDLIEMVENPNGKPTGATRRLRRISVRTDINCIQQSEGSLPRILFGHDIRVM
jgi:hypothetical protein